MAGNLKRCAMRAACVCQGWAHDMISRANAEYEYELAPELMAELSDRDEPLRIDRADTHCALMRIRWRRCVVTLQGHAFS